MKLFIIFMRQTVNFLYVLDDFMVKRKNSTCYSL